MNSGERDSSLASPPVERFPLWTWIRFALTSLTLAFLGYLMLVGAFFAGGHDGRGPYLVGAVVTTGTFAAWAVRAGPRPLRVTAAVFAVLTTVFWLVELSAFLSSSGFQF